MHGKGGMPAFAKMLKADELAEVITYTRNALGNKVGDEIQPKAIQDLLSQTSGAAAAAAPVAKAAPQEKIDAKCSAVER